jgi:LacI family transcriptional regulator
MHNKSKPRISLLANLTKPYDRQVVEGILEYARDVGWSVYLEERPEERVPDIQSRRWDGIICDLDDFEYLECLKHLSGTPVVGYGGLKDEYRGKLRISTVDNDEYATAKMAIEHLQSAGYSRLAFCGMQLKTPDDWMEERESHFVEIARSKQLPFHVFTGRRSSRHFVEMLDELSHWIAELPKPVGIMACNDSRARHVIEACRRSDVPIPDAVGVLGVDNNALVCELTDPPLSSIQPRTRELGRAAAKLLHQSMSGSRKLERIEFPPLALLIRASTELSHSEDPLLAHGIRIIRESLHKPLSINQMCRTVGVSRTTLDQRFIAKLGRSVHEEIVGRRLALANTLLTKSELTIGEISKRCGFSSQQYFCNVYRKSFGCTPGSLRRT